MRMCMCTRAYVSASVFVCVCVRVCGWVGSWGGWLFGKELIVEGTWNDRGRNKKKSGKNEYLCFITENKVIRKKKVVELSTKRRLTKRN